MMLEMLNKNPYLASSRSHPNLVLCLLIRQIQAQLLVNFLFYVSLGPY